MIKIMFVCYGNICRSPMAEFIMKDLIKKRGLLNKFIIESRSTSTEEIGNDMYYLAKEKLKEKNISFNKRKAKQLTKNDYNNFDYIIGMEDFNVRSIKKIVMDDRKVYKLLDFTDNSKDIDDPWYTRDFETTFKEIYTGCSALLDFILKNDFIV